MPGSMWRLFFVSVMRAAIAAVGAVLVREGFVDHTLMQDVASAAAFLLVDRAWELYQLHRAELSRALYQRWLVVLGLQSAPYIQPSVIAHAARERTEEGMQP